MMKGGFHRRFLSDPSRHGHKPVKLHQAGIGVFKKRPVSGAIIVSADAVFKIVPVPAAASPAKGIPPARSAILRHRQALLDKSDFLSSGIHRLDGILRQVSDPIGIRI